MTTGDQKFISRWPGSSQAVPDAERVTLRVEDAAGVTHTLMVDRPVRVEMELVTSLDLSPAGERLGT